MTPLLVKWAALQLARHYMIDPVCIERDLWDAIDLRDDMMNYPM